MQARPAAQGPQSSIAHLPKLSQHKAGAAGRHASLHVSLIVLNMHHIRCINMFKAGGRQPDRCPAAAVALQGEAACSGIFQFRAEFVRMEGICLDCLVWEPIEIERGGPEGQSACSQALEEWLACAGAAAQHLQGWVQGRLHTFAYASHVCLCRSLYARILCNTCMDSSLAGGLQACTQQALHRLPHADS